MKIFFVLALDLVVFILFGFKLIDRKSFNSFNQLDFQFPRSSVVFMIFHIVFATDNTRERIVSPYKDWATNQNNHYTILYSFYIIHT